MSAELDLDPDAYFCNDIIKRIWDPFVVILCYSIDGFLPNFNLQICNVENKYKVTCESNDLGNVDSTYNYRILGSHFYVFYEPFFGSCDVKVFNYDNLTDFMTVSIPHKQVCYIEDIKIMVVLNTALLLISDRI